MAAKGTSLETLAGGITRIAETTRITQKDVKDIRDAICGGEVSKYLKTIAKTAEELQKEDFIKNLKGGTGKDSKKGKESKSSEFLKGILEFLKKKDKSSKKNNRISLNNIESKDSQGRPGLMSLSVDMVKKMKDVSLKDFIAARLKLPILKNIINQSQDTFKNFENAKEVEETISFVNSSSDMVEKLASLKQLKRAKKASKMIDQILFGDKKDDEGLVGVLKKLEEKDNKKAINASTKNAKNLLAFSGSMIAVALGLIAMIPLVLPAVLGLAMTSLIIKGLANLFEKLGNKTKNLKKGSTAMALLGTCVLSLSAAFFILNRTVKEIGGFKDMLKLTGMIAIMTGTMLGVSGVAILFGKSMINITKGSLAMAAVGGGLVGFSIGFQAMKTAAAGLTLKDAGVMVAAIAGTGLAVAGLGLLAAPIALGSASILLIGTSLGILGLTLEKWKEFDAGGAVENIKTTIGNLKDALGFNDNNTRTTKDGEVVERSGLGKILANTGSALAGIISSVGMAGSTLMIVASLAILRHSLVEWTKMTDVQTPIDNIKNAMTSVREAFSGGKKGDTDGYKNLKKEMKPVVKLFRTMNALRRNLQKWDEYDGKKAIGNIQTAITSLRTAFGEMKMEKSEKKEIKQTKNRLDDTVGYITKLLKNMRELRRNLKRWDKFDATKAIGNIKNSITQLRTLFNEDLNTTKDEKKDFKHSVNQVKDSLGPVTRLLKDMRVLKRNLKIWDKFDGTQAVTNIQNTITALKNVLGDDGLPVQNTVDAINMLDISKANAMRDVFKSIADIKEVKPFEQLTNAINKFTTACNEMTEALNNIENLNTPENTTESVISSMTSDSSVSENNGDLPQQIADAIANTIRNINVKFNPGMLDINLIAESCSGKSVKLTLQD